MINYELERLRCDLDSLKDDLRNYLIATYKNENADSLVKAKGTFLYLSGVVDKIIKRQAYSLKWGPKGTAQWHATILDYISKWVFLELEVSKLLSQMIEAEQ